MPTSSTRIGRRSMPFDSLKARAAPPSAATNCERSDSGESKGMAASDERRASNNTFLQSSPATSSLVSILTLCSFVSRAVLNLIARSLSSTLCDRKMIAIGLSSCTDQPRDSRSLKGMVRVVMTGTVAAPRESRKASRKPAAAPVWLAWPPEHQPEADHGHHVLAGLIAHGVTQRDQPAVRLAARGPRLEHLDAHGQGVRRPHRRQPAQLVDPRRAETAGDPVAEAARAAAEGVIDHHAHAERGGMPAAGDEAAIGRAPGGFLVEVEWLRIELPGEVDDLLAGDLPRWRLPDVAGMEVFEIESHGCAGRGLIERTSVPGEQPQGGLVEERFVLSHPHEEHLARAARRLRLEVLDPVGGRAPVAAGRIGHPVLGLGVQLLLV